MDGVVAGALTSLPPTNVAQHPFQPSITCGLGLLLVTTLLWGFFFLVLRFSFLTKTNSPNSNSSRIKTSWADWCGLLSKHCNVSITTGIPVPSCWISTTFQLIIRELLDKVFQYPTDYCCVFMLQDLEVRELQFYTNHSQRRRIHIHIS